MSDPVNPPATSPEDRLAYTEGVLLRFTNGSSQWVNIKRFTLRDAGIDGVDVLSLLLRHACYRDSYAGTTDKETASVHGPYRLDAIRAEAFVPLEPESAVAKLRTWAEQDAPLDDVTRERLERKLYPRVLAATECYQLDGLGEESQHDWGWVVGQTGFVELVLINRAVQSLELVVASDD
jgi:hypothetical protein